MIPGAYRTNLTKKIPGAYYNKSNKKAELYWKNEQQTTQMILSRTAY